MICDNCDGRKICKFKEDCMIYERNLISQNSFRNNQIFGATMTCTEKTTTSTMFTTRTCDGLGSAIPCSEYPVGETLTHSIPKNNMKLDSTNRFVDNNINTKAILDEISTKLKK